MSTVIGHALHDAAAGELVEVLLADDRSQHLIDLERALPRIFSPPELVQPPAEDDRWESEEDAQRHRTRPRP